MAPRRFVLIMVGTMVGAGLLGGWLAVRHGGEAVNNWMMAVQAVAGVLEIQWGLANRHSDVRANRMIGPLGFLLLGGPVFHFLPNDMPLGIRMAAALMFWLVAAIWFVRARRPARSSD